MKFPVSEITAAFLAYVAAHPYLGAATILCCVFLRHLPDIITATGGFIQIWRTTAEPNHTPNNPPLKLPKNRKKPPE